VGSEVGLADLALEEVDDVVVEEACLSKLHQGVPLQLLEGHLDKPVQGLLAHVVEELTCRNERLVGILQFGCTRG
jgi:hypothetical protein